MHTFVIGSHCYCSSVHQPEKPFIETDGEGAESLDGTVERNQQTTEKGQQSASGLQR